MLVEALANTECFRPFFFQPVIKNVEVIILITSPTAFFFYMWVSVRVHVCCSTKGCMTVKGWLRFFFFVLKDVSLALLSLLRCFFSPFRGVLPLLFFLMYHGFVIFLFTKRIMLFVLSTVKQSLLQHWKAISLYETFTMYLLWLTFDSSSLLFTCTLGVIIEVNLFYTNTKSVLWLFFFLVEHMDGKISILRERDELESQERFRQ